MQVLSSMRFKDFTWDNNPKTCKYAITRAFAKHKYPELYGVELEDMDPDTIIITGDGEFFGVDAYAKWSKLVNTFNQHGVGEFNHPIYKDITRALMTKLESSLEPRENYVAYSFEFMADNIIKSVRTVLPDTTPTNSETSIIDPSTNRAILVGDVVICNGYAYYTSYGSNPRSALMTNKSMVVTHVNYSGTHPICVGSVGWMKLSDIKLSGTAGTVANSTAITYTSKVGDTLSSIGRMFGVSWQTIATLNNIKNPNILSPGTVLKIPTSTVTTRQQITWKQTPTQAQLDRDYKKMVDPD
jgi:LysM repeat protein